MTNKTKLTVVHIDLSVRTKRKGSIIDLDTRTVAYSLFGGTSIVQATMKNLILIVPLHCSKKINHELLANIGI